MSKADKELIDDGTAEELAPLFKTMVKKMHGALKPDQIVMLAERRGEPNRYVVVVIDIMTKFTLNPQGGVVYPRAWGVNGYGNISGAHAQLQMCFDNMGKPVWQWG